MRPPAAHHSARRQRGVLGGRSHTRHSAVGALTVQLPTVVQRPAVQLASGVQPLGVQLRAAAYKVGCTTSGFVVRSRALALLPAGRVTVRGVVAARVSPTVLCTQRAARRSLRMFSAQRLVIRPTDVPAAVCPVLISPVDRDLTPLWATPTAVTQDHHDRQHLITSRHLHHFPDTSPSPLSTYTPSPTHHYQYSKAKNPSTTHPCITIRRAGRPAAPGVCRVCGTGTGVDLLPFVDLGR